MTAFFPVEQSRICAIPLSLSELTGSTLRVLPGRFAAGFNMEDSNCKTIKYDAISFRMK